MAAMLIPLALWGAGAATYYRFSGPDLLNSRFTLDGSNSAETVAWLREQNPKPKRRKVTDPELLAKLNGTGPWTKYAAKPSDAEDEFDPIAEGLADPVFEPEDYAAVLHGANDKYLSESAAADYYRPAVVDENERRTYRNAADAQESGLFALFAALAAIGCYLASRALGWIIAGAMPD